MYSKDNLGKLPKMTELSPKAMAAFRNPGDRWNILQVRESETDAGVVRQASRTRG